MRRAIPCLFVLLALVASSPTASGAPSYLARWKWAIPVAGPWIEEQTTTTPPAEVAESFDTPAGPICGAGVTSTYAYFHSRAESNRLGQWIRTAPQGSATGSCQAGGRELAKSTFNVLFQCPPGTQSPIDVTMHFRAEGAAFVTNQSPPPGVVARLALEVGAGSVVPSLPLVGRWVPEDANTQVSSGVFASQPLTNSLSGLFAAPTASVNLDGNGYGAGEFALSSLLVTELNSGTGVSEMHFNGPGEGVFLPVGTPVFDNLPTGCTCNSVDANIVDNYVVDGPVSVDQDAGSWGKVKAQYR